MKSLLTIFLSIFCLPFLSQELAANFSVSGKIENYEGQLVVLSTGMREMYLIDFEPKIIDTTVVKNKQFEISGNIKESAHVYLWVHNVSDSDYHIITFTLNPNSRVKIDGDLYDFENAELEHYIKDESGNLTLSDENKIAEALEDNYFKRLDELWTKFDTIPEDKGRKLFNGKYKKYKKAIDEFFEEYEKTSLEFIRENPGSYESLLLLNEICVDYFYDYKDLSIVKELYSAMPEISKEHSLAKEIYELAFQIEENLSAPIVMELPDTSGRLFNLESLRGKYVLIDFWSSWCGPCRAETPNLKKAYEKYHPLGLEIVSITWDDEEEDWFKAIEKDGMNWINLYDYDIQNDNFPTFDKYGVFGVPTIYLLDKDGYIIAEGLRGKKLDKKHNEVYGGK